MLSCDERSQCHNGFYIRSLIERKQEADSEGHGQVTVIHTHPSTNRVLLSGCKRRYDEVEIGGGQ